MTTSDNISAIEAIEKALEGVTPGPWHVAESGLGNKMKAPTVYHAGDDLNYVASFADFMTFHGPTRNLENARYIAACHPVAMREVLALARKAEAMEREIAELRDALKPFSVVEPVSISTSDGHISSDAFRRVRALLSKESAEQDGSAINSKGNGCE